MRERLGGLAQPRTIAFVEAFPADLPHDLRRRALRLVCAADRASTFIISAESLRAAVVAALVKERIRSGLRFDVEVAVVGELDPESATIVDARTWE